MAANPIQEKFGEQVIKAFAEFARADLKSPSDLASEDLSHISDVKLRTRLSEVFYGVRWIYKLGLALLTKDEERAAHVRAQIVDYASVCEGILSHCLAHAIRNGHTRGAACGFRDPDRKTQPITWNPAHPEPTLNRQSFWWLIRIARECAIIDSALAADLQWLRLQRNSVHLRQKSSLGKTAFLNQSKRAFTVCMETMQQSRAWKTVHR